jgi:membrane fusion protein (multidrug efflux system)
MADIVQPNPIGPSRGRWIFVPSRVSLKRTALALALMAGTAVVAYFGYHYWTVGQYFVSTDDAYVQADYTTVAPKISGYLTEVTVKDNERVKAGAVLARIDDRDFRTALDQTKADLEATEAAVANIDAQIALQKSVIAEDQANITGDEGTLTFAEQDNARYRELEKTGVGTVQRYQQAAANLTEKTAQLDHDRAALVADERKLDVLATARSQAEAQRDHARAVEHQAELNLSYTVITAAVDGTVGARSLRVGQYVQAGTQLMAVVPLHAVYVVANFKETQLTHIRDGQPVNIAVDSFPDTEIRGHVDSFAPASGLEFALLPPDNATGNFTKIVQRIPVKIVIDDDGLVGLLRAGMSVEPSVDTRPATTNGEGR